MNFLNQVYSQKHIPNEWRNVIIQPVYKKGDRNNPQNYRGISILNDCYKFFAKIINIKLQIYSENFIMENQNGFKGAMAEISAILVKNHFFILLQK